MMDCVLCGVSGGDGSVTLTIGPHTFSLSLEESTHIGDAPGSKDSKTRRN